MLLLLCMGLKFSCVTPLGSDPVPELFQGSRTHFFFFFKRASFLARQERAVCKTLTFLRSSTMVGAGKSEELGEEQMRLTAYTVDGWSQGKQ